MYQLLIVDDEFEIRNGLLNYDWKKLGFSVCKALENGALALEYVNNNHVDVVLCDVRMPIMDGLVFAEAIKKEKIGVKIVFLSGYRDFEYVQKAMRYGGCDYLLKPTRFHQLDAVFRTLKKELDDENMQEVIYREQMLGEGQKEAQDKEKLDLIIESVKHYSIKHLATSTLEEVAVFVGLSPTYLSKYFKDKTGKNYKEFLVELRMNKAKEMLSDVRNKIYEISQSTGYTSPQNFTRAFKAYFGYSPSEFRSVSDKESNK